MTNGTLTYSSDINGYWQLDVPGYGRDLIGRGVKPAETYECLDQLRDALKVSADSLGIVTAQIHVIGRDGFAIGELVIDNGTILGSLKRQERSP